MRKIINRPTYVSSRNGKERNRLIDALLKAGYRGDSPGNTLTLTLRVEPDTKRFSNSSLTGVVKAADLLASIERGETHRVLGFSDYNLTNVDRNNSKFQLGCQVGTIDQARAIFELAKKQRRAKRPLDLEATRGILLFGNYEVSRITSTGGVDSYGEVEPFAGVAALMDFVDPPKKRTTKKK